MNTPAAIKRFRMELGLNHKEFAKLLKVNPSTISHYESGRRHPLWPTIKKIVALAKKHGVALKYEDFAK